MRQSRYISEFSSATKWRIPVVQQRTDNGEQMPQEQFQSVEQNQNPVQRVHKKIEIPQFAQETMRFEIRRMTLEKTFEERGTLIQAVVRIVNGTARAWSIQHEIREIISPASTKQAMEMQVEVERRKREEILQSEGDQQSEVSWAQGRLRQC